MNLPKKIVAIDTETTGLNPYRRDVHAIIISYWTNKGTGKVYQLDKEEPTRVKNYLADKSILKLFWNASFDIPIIKKLGYSIRGPVIDCMFMAEMAFPEEKRKSLKNFSRKFLDDDYREEIELRKFIRKNKIDKKRRGYRDVPLHLILPYAIKDAKNTYELFEYLSEAITAYRLWPHLILEMRLLKEMVLPMQAAGIKVDIPKASQLLKEGRKELARLKDTICSLVGEPSFNPNSSQQVVAAIYPEGPDTATRYTKNGNPSGDELALLELMSSKKVGELAKNLIKYRKISKAVSTFLGNVIQAVDDDNIFRVSFNQTRARTGRFSSSGYDIKGQLQNIPRSTNDGVLGSIRDIFIARPGYRLVCIDLDQVEMRIQAHFLQDQEMIEAIKRGDDLHSLACKRYLKCKVTPERRYAAKTLNYAGTYGAGANKFRDTVKKESDGEITIPYELAAMAIENYRAMTQPLTDRVIEEYSEHGGVHDFYGRFIPVDEEMIYAGNNYIIQGTAAGYMKRVGLKCVKLLKGKKSRMLITVHDEYVFEIHQSEKYLVPKLKETMEDYTTFLVPITATVSIGKSWGSKKKIEV